MRCPWLFTCRVNRELRTREVLGSLRRHQRRQLPEMRYQGVEAGQEEEDKKRNQDPAEPVRRSKHRRSAGCRQGPTSKSILSSI